MAFDLLPLFKNPTPVLDLEYAIARLDEKYVPVPEFMNGVINLPTGLVLVRACRVDDRKPLRI